MNFSTLLSLILANISKLPTLLPVLESLAQNLKEIGKILTGKGAPDGPTTSAISALSADDQITVSQIETRATALGIEGGRILKLIGLLRTLAPVLLPLIGSLLGQPVAQGVEDEASGLSPAELEGISELAHACQLAQTEADSEGVSAQALGDGKLIQLLISNLPALLKLLAMFGVKLPTV